MLEHRVEGILIGPASDHSAATLRLIGQQGVPFVLVDRAVQGTECDVVQGDSVGDARKLIQHLIANGHRRIAMIAGVAEVSTSRDRFHGYCEAMEAAQLPIEPELIIASNFDTEGGYQATQRLLWSNQHPDAIFAINNLVAVGVVRALREHRLAIPGDVALACFDDIEYAALLCPFLTVMEQPAESYGRIATDRLLERIAGRGTDTLRSVVLSAELIVRDSSGRRNETRV
jgi:LacI family transcriptional regulator